MATKTDRILGYLPGTFRPLPRPTALYSVADAFGNELQQAENALVSVMRSHWVDFADQGEDIIDDLASIARLYGLAPRDDESVEEFRAHLKHYIRTFLEGTPTVQGILRVAAEALGLQIADDYEQIDTWWTRPDEKLVTVQARGDDASPLLFGRILDAQGAASSPARIAGTTDLSAGVDLTGATNLSISVDGKPAVVVDFSSVPNLVSTSTADIVTAINQKFTSPIADCPDGKHLVLSSPTPGSSGKLAVEDVSADSAPRLLGLSPRTYRGSAEVHAQVVGTVDMGPTVDLSDKTFLRLLIDGTKLAEVDCAGTNPSATTPAEIVTSINSALGTTVAGLNGTRLMLTSPTVGFSSTIQFQSPAAQDATPLLFGKVNPIYTGQAAQPASVQGVRDLSVGVDLSENSKIEIAVDEGAHLLIECAGANASSTTADEIVSAINLAAGRQIASQNGKFVSLTSPTTGVDSSIRFFTPATGDATASIFGLPSRSAVGQQASSAKLPGVDVPAGEVDLRAQHLLHIAIDGGKTVELDFWKTFAEREKVSLGNLANAINEETGRPVAAVEGQHVVLTSPAQGAASQLQVVPLRRILQRRFVSRAFVLDEASQKVLGMYQKKVFGGAATPARVEGEIDLARGIDLRSDPFLQLSVDGGPALLIDCSTAAARPRVSLPDEIATAINAEVTKHALPPIASHDENHLFLTSPSSGAASSIEFLPVLAVDASGTFGLTPTTVFGHDATRVVFRSTVDLSSGAGLSTNSKVKLAVDGAAPVEIDCAGADPTHTTLEQIVTLINTALSGVVASAGGKTISLISPTTGANSSIEILAPATGDATAAIFGVTPRRYHGEEAASPQLIGSKDIGAGVDLRVAKFLRLGYDAAPIVTIDCSDGAAKPDSVKLSEIVSAINKATNKTIAASPDSKHLVLTGPTAGVSGKLVVENSTSGGIVQKLFGNVPQRTSGTGPVPAVVTGTVDLLDGVDLSERRILRLALDGSQPYEIDISGSDPARTFLTDIVASINAVLPGVASASADDQLVLTSPTGGEDSSLEILPGRVLEVLEYPAKPASMAKSLRHGDRFFIENAGAADSVVRVEVSSAQGVAGIELVNRSKGVRVRVMDAKPSGGWLRLRADDKSGLLAEIWNAAGVRSVVPNSRILVGPLGRQAWIPYSYFLRLGGGGSDTWASLQLNNPQTSFITILRARRRGLAGGRTKVSVVPASLPSSAGPAVTGEVASPIGKLQFEDEAWKLLDASDTVLAILRAGAAVSFKFFNDLVVQVEGKYYAETPVPLLLVESIARLFDVTIEGPTPDGTTITESYAAVSIATGTMSARSLTQQVLSRPSQLVVAQDFDKANVLQLSRGRSDWSFLTSDGARFNHATFDQAHFAGGKCLEQGVFNASLFACTPDPPHNPPKEPEAAVFANGVLDPVVQVSFEWTTYQPGVFQVNLPAELPERFGARFNQARFARRGDAPEVYSGVVIEPAKEPPGSPPNAPPTDPDWIVNRINQSSTLVLASLVQNVPLGWDDMPVPFRHPRDRALVGGTDHDSAALFLSESGVPGFIKVEAKKVGAWGNTIEVTVRKVGPARFDVTIGYEGAKFENARQTVLAGQVFSSAEDPLPALSRDLVTPRPVGVLQGKAAGVLAKVTRDLTESETDF